MKSFTGKTDGRPGGRKKNPFLNWVLLLATAGFFVLSLAAGASGFSLGNSGIVLYLRLPRTLGCVLAGAALSVAGLILQTTLNNSLAGPGIIGINSGAGLAAVLAALLFAQSLLARTLATFAGALLTALLIYGIGRASGASRNRIILAGIAVSRLFSALIDAVVLARPEAVMNRAAFQLGTLAGSNYGSLAFAGPVTVIGLISALALSGNLGMLAFGDDVAASMGLNVRRFRFGCLLSAAVLSAGAVGIAGLLSFLGLMVPHMARSLAGTDSYPRLTVSCALGGAALTLVCDLLARTVMMPYELPAGIVMSLAGVPFFLFLLFGRGRRDRVD